MTDMLARVELHSAGKPEYDRLHVSMANLGFSRTIPTIDATKNQLPEGTYVLAKSPFTVEQVEAQVKRAADLIRPNSMVIVTNMGETWLHLPVVK